MRFRTSCLFDDVGSMVVTSLLVLEPYSHNQREREKMMKPKAIALDFDGVLTVAGEGAKRED